MYDIRIFIENNGEFGGRVNAGKEIIYGVGKNHDELIKNLRDGLILAFQKNKLTKNTNRLVSFLENNKKDTICH
ncbi:MAG: hypothetical protein WC850_05695 [Candidatus Gracilibacteria bacterium]